MNLVTVLGLFAGSLTTIAFLPQVIKTWRTRSTKDISLEMFAIFCSGVLLWIIYGSLVKDIPVSSWSSEVLTFKTQYARLRLPRLI